MKITLLSQETIEYDDDNPDDEKSEVESYDSELNEIIADDDVVEEDVDLNEEDDEFSDDDETEE